ncbi:MULTISPECIES: EVE domain-containing protein [unclassified Nocardia]|uniref:EVE domain-containing protein n=1 Tax=unclassified Nocardia TaxID=2637762 RepID=UPI001CE40D6D|nr:MULTISPECIES: EVE domain-containing protein [unclassified Nocardia]
MTKYWLNVVSREHVLRGAELGIVQANHGKRHGIERMTPGDGLVYYSPREGMRTGAPVRAFTAIGVVADRPAWQAVMEGVTAPGGGCFEPWRRAVHYRTDAREIPIERLRAELELTSGPNWGIVLRRGLIELSEHDFAVISAAMLDDTIRREGGR